MYDKADVSVVSQDEFPRLLEICEAAVRATHHFLTEADIEFFRPVVANEAFFAVQLACVRESSGRIIGFIGTAGDKIEMLFVDPEYHGHGVGRRLVDYAVNSEGATAVDVNEQNPQAVAFYLRLGFAVSGRSDLDSLGKPFPLLHLEFAGASFLSCSWYMSSGRKSKRPAQRSFR